MERQKRNDIVLIVVIIIAAALWFILRGGTLSVIGIGGNASSDGKRIVITVNDDEVYSENADSLMDKLPVTLDIAGYSGGHNVFVIDKDADGDIEIYCKEADCPDKICVETGHISLPDQPIVCLPHRVTARIIEKK